jgi:DNA-binding CsgD family transcriptional regulator
LALLNPPNGPIVPVWQPPPPSIGSASGGGDFSLLEPQVRARCGKKGGDLSSVNGMCWANSAAMKLTYKIIGHQTDDILDILRQFAADIGVDHIAYVRMGSNKSLESSLLASYVTYPKEWQRRYFLKQYFLTDPILRYGMNTSLNHFDWGDVEEESSTIKDFFSDAARHKVGSNGISILVRNRKNSYAIVSFTSDVTKETWQKFKSINIDKLYHASVLIDSAATTGSNRLEISDVNLSLREEQCLIWAARGKTYEEIGEITTLSYYSVRSHLDIARHKLHGTNLTNAVAIALARGVIPPIALREPL